MNKTEISRMLTAKLQVTSYKLQVTSVNWFMGCRAVAVKTTAVKMSEKSALASAINVLR
jgi:hypothetical protein